MTHKVCIQKAFVFVCLFFFNTTVFALLMLYDFSSFLTEKIVDSIHTGMWFCDCAHVISQLVDHIWKNFHNMKGQGFDKAKGFEQQSAMLQGGC